MGTERETSTDLWLPSTTMRQACADAVNRIAALYPKTSGNDSIVNDMMSVLTSEYPDSSLSDGPPPGDAVSADGTPLEISIRTRAAGDVEVRWDMNVAPGIAGRTVDARRNAWEAGRRVAKRLEQRFGANLEVFDRLADLLVPDQANGGRLIGFASGLPLKGTPRFQCYFTGGPGPGSDLQVLQAASALGMRASADAIAGRLSAADRIWMAADLVKGADARVKLYASLQSYDIDQIESFRSIAGEYWPVDDVRSLLTKLYGEVPRVPPRNTGAILCFHFREGKVTEVAFDVGTSPFEIDLADDEMLSDGEILRRFSAILNDLGLSSEPYERAVATFAGLPLEEETAIQQRVAFLRDHRGLAATMYLGPRFYVHRFGFAYQDLGREGSEQSRE